ncbi:hypothetical protein ABZ912_19770 [Nonomuraea angiospora]|uniref:hypothetical protein n=1 Tax=Nonomuraea angiospora TaxID=46172 RepID=UPI0033F369D7
MTSREQQLAAANALVALLSEDPPLPLPNSWWFYNGGEEVNGQISPAQGTAEQRQSDIRKWADFLGAEIEVTRYDKPGGSVAAVGEYEGVRVKVWSAFTKRELPNPAQPSVRGGEPIGHEAEALYREEQTDRD